MPKSKATPIACTLTPEDFDSRLAWIAELTRDALREYRRRDLVLELTYAPEAAHRVREMVRRERACCAFLAFDLREEPDAVRLILTAPEDARAAADTLFEQFEHSKQWPTRAKACTGFLVSDRPKGPQPLDDVDRGFGLLPWPGIGATPMSVDQPSHDAGLGAGRTPAQAERRQAWLAAGGMLGAFASMSCCVVPLVLFSLGVGGAWIGNLTALAPYQPIFVAITLGFLGAGFWLVYLRPKPACTPGEACARPLPGRIVKTSLSLATILVAAALVFPYAAPTLLGP